MEYGLLEKLRKAQLILFSKIKVMVANKKNIKKEIKITEEEIKFPSINLLGKEIPKEVLKEIPEEAAVFYRFVPIAKKGNLLEIGMVDPSDLKAKEALRFITRRNKIESKIFVISEEDINKVLKQYRTLGGEVKKALKELDKELESDKEVGYKKEKVEDRVSSIVSDAPITKIVAVMLKHAVEGRASDIHIEAAKDSLKIRFRVDGILYNSLVLPKDVHSSIVSRIKILSNLKIDETRVPQDGRFHTMIGGIKIDFRVSTLPTVNGEKVVLRVLDPNVGLKTFPELGLHGYNLKTLESTIKKPFGMILITGPTGSGKTTTLYSILNKLNQEAVNIVSLEDPVEYFIEGINQSQIRPEIDYSFASGLRHILRQDPDIIMVGEIRDEETASLAIHASLTGHILLSTLHTNDASGVVPRLIDLNINSFLLPNALNLSIAQRLVRRLCDKCKEEIEAPPEISEVIEKEIEKLSIERKKEFEWKRPFKIYKKKGCSLCGNKGVKGRIAIYEIIIMTPQLEKIIINKELSDASLKEEALRQGMITMKQDGIYKILQGVVSFEEVIRVVEE